MTARPARFRQKDVTRAMKAAMEAGMAVGRVEIEPDGRIVVAAATEPARPQTELDRWLERSDAR